MSSYVPPTRRRRESTRDDDGGGWICRYVLDTGNNNKGRTGEESKDKLVRRIQVAQQQQQKQQQQQQRPIDSKSTIHLDWLAGGSLVSSSSSSSSGLQQQRLYSLELAASHPLLGCILVHMCLPTKWLTKEAAFFKHEFEESVSLAIFKPAQTAAQFSCGLFCIII